MPCEWCGAEFFAHICATCGTEDCEGHDFCSMVHLAAWAYTVQVADDLAGL